MDHLEKPPELLFLLFIPLPGFFAIALALFAMWPRIVARLEKKKQQ